MFFNGIIVEEVRVEKFYVFLFVLEIVDDENNKLIVVFIMSIEDVKSFKENVIIGDVCQDSGVCEIQMDFYVVGDLIN